MSNDQMLLIGFLLFAIGTPFYVKMIAGFVFQEYFRHKLAYHNLVLEAISQTEME